MNSAKAIHQSVVIRDEKDYQMISDVKIYNYALTSTQVYDIINFMKYKGYKVYTFKEHLKELLKDPEFKKEWENSEVEYQLGCKLIEARLKRGISQRDLAKKVGTSQAAISRIESMNGNPSLSFLKRISAALGSKLQISI